MNDFSQRAEVLIEELDLGENTSMDEGKPVVSNVLETRPMKIENLDPKPKLSALIADVAANSAVSTNRADEFYSALSAKDAKYLRDSANAIKAFERKFLIKIGAALSRVRQECPGKFVEWLKVEFGKSTGSAYNYLAVWEKFGKTPMVIDALPVRTVYKLAARGTPDAVRDAVVNEIVNGVALSADDVERRIAEGKRSEKERTVSELKPAEATGTERQIQHARNGSAETLRAAASVGDDIKREPMKPRQDQESLKDGLEEGRERQDQSTSLFELKRQAAFAAAKFLRQRLGADFEEFRSMIADLSLDELHQALQELISDEATPTREMPEVEDNIELHQAA